MSFPRDNYYQDNLQHSFKDPNKTPEKHLLLQPRGYNPGVYASHLEHQPALHRQQQQQQQPNVRFSDPRHRSRVGLRETSFPVERHSLMEPGPVKLTPSWEEKNLPHDELNFKHMTLDDDLSVKRPRDRLNAVYLILLLHGIGTLMPWNMFITVNTYFSDFKLNSTLTDVSTYRDNFLSYLGLASQIPALVFNWLNLFVQLGGDLTTRIVFSILVEVVIVIGTIVLAMIDSSAWPVAFFWITMASVVVINMANGVYQNSVFGLAAKLPMAYSNAVILGSNICGVLTAIINIVFIAVSPNIHTAAIYYFITALFVLLACFDTYFALPLLRFYRYHDKQARVQNANKDSSRRPRTPYWSIFKKTFPQLFNVFMVFFVTLSIFPAVQSKIQMLDKHFIIPEKYFIPVTCFLVFNLFALLGNSTPFLFQRPGPRWLCIPVLLRLLFIPCFMFCNYHPDGERRLLPVLIYNDWAFVTLGVLFGWSSGYLSSLAMMYAPRCVDPQYAGIAGMMGGASLVLGLFCGVNFSLFIPWVVQNVEFYI